MKLTVLVIVGYHCHRQTLHRYGTFFPSPLRIVFAAGNWNPRLGASPLFIS